MAKIVPEIHQWLPSGPPYSGLPDSVLVFNPIASVSAKSQTGFENLRSGRYEAAIADYTQAILLNPKNISNNNSGYYFDRGWAYSALGRYEAAIADFTQAILLQPNFGDSYFKRGWAHAALGRYEAAIADYTQAIQRASKPSGIRYYWRGVAKFGLKKYELAVADYTQAIRLGHENSKFYPKFYVGRGQANEQLKRFQEARTDYKTALNLAQKAGVKSLADTIQKAIQNLRTKEAQSRKVKIVTVPPKNRDTAPDKLVDKQKVAKPQERSARDRTAEVQRKNRTEGMVLIREGKFRMGTDKLVGNESKPIHTVYLDAFYIDTHEVTVGEYKEFLKESGYPVSLHSALSEFSSTDDHPVVGVSWHDAMAYAKWAGKRLPTEAEWEKAARGGLIDMMYPWGNDEIDSAKANYGELHSGTVPIGSYPPPNAFGLYDMAGNVAEWCLDPWDNNFYANSPAENPFAGHKSRDETIIDYKNVRGLRVVRGGSWAHNTSASFWVSGRFKYDARKKPMNIGFRCAKDAP